MTPQLMVPPSFLMHSGIRISQVENLTLFKFTDELQSRMEELLEKHKTGLLKPDEETEYAGISELDRIFTWVNAQLIAQQKSKDQNYDFSDLAGKLGLQGNPVEIQTRMRDAW